MNNHPVLFPKSDYQVSYAVEVDLWDFFVGIEVVRDDE